MPDDAALLDLVDKAPEYRPSPESRTQSPIRTWEAPLALDERAVPEFPLNALPPILSTLCAECSTAYQVPTDLPALLSLGCAAMALAGRIMVCLRVGWVEPVNIYTVIAMPPGERKSPVYRKLTDFIYRHQSFEIERMRPVIAEAVTRRKLLEKTLTKALEKASKSKDEKAKDDALRLGQEIEELAVPAEPRFVMDDATPEALARMMAEQGGRIAILSTEGGIFDIMAGRYSSSLNIDVYLKAHSGDPLLIDRIARGANRIENPALTMVLTVQPGVIAGLTSRPEFRARGLLGRVLYSIPRSIVGSREIDAPPLNEPALKEWERILARLLGIPPAEGSLILMLTPAAQSTIKEFERWLEPQLGPGGSLEPLADWANKLAGHLGRIAALLHMIRHAEEFEPWHIALSGDTMKDAVIIGNYLIAHALKAFDLMGSNPHADLARRAVRCLARDRPSIVSRRDLMRALHLSRADIADAVLAILEDHGYVAALEREEAIGQRHRARFHFAVNPAIWERAGNEEKI